MITSETMWKAPEVTMGRPKEQGETMQINTNERHVVTPSRIESTTGLRAAMKRRRHEGMTLVELMIVVIIMALIATAVGVAVLPQIKKARIKSTKADAQQVRSAVALWLSDNPSKCPSIDDLVQGGVLDKSKRTTDAWDNAFSVQCEGDDVTVISAGPDGQMGSEDDIR